MEEVELIHQAVQAGRRGPRGVPMPDWVCALCSHWITEARQEDGRDTLGDAIGKREALAHQLVEELLTALDLALRKAAQGKGDDYVLRALPNPNHTVTLQLVPGAVIPVLLPRGSLQALITIVLELVDKEDSIYWTAEAVRGLAILEESLFAYTSREGR